MTDSGRVMGLDIGRKRIGVALSDLLRVTAQPHTTIDAEAGDAVEQMQLLIEQEQVTQVVVGLPKRLDGSQGDLAQLARSIGKEIGDRTGVPVRYWDERFSTHAAERSLLEANVRRNKRKQVIDKTAAAWILQGYLDATSVP